MELDPHEQQIADALAEHRARSRDGTPPPVEVYEAPLGPAAFAELEALLAVEKAIDRALGEEVEEARPRARPGLRPVLAIAAVLVLGLLVWQWVDRAPAPGPPGEAGSHAYVAWMERKLLGHEQPQSLVPLPATRGGGGPEYGLAPTGLVRPADLRVLTLRLPELAPLLGRLVIRMEDGTLLHEQPLERTRSEERIRLPAEAVAAVTEAGEALWGFEADDGSSWVVPVEVLAPEETRAVDAKLAEVRTRAASLPASVRAWLEASALMDRGLFGGAYETARAAARPPEEEGASPLPWLQVREALHRMGQWDSPLGVPAYRALGEFTEAGHDLSAFFEVRAAGR